MTWRRTSSWVVGFADLLVIKVCEDLNDEERAFIGIPLQCRIIAECFESQVLGIVKQNVTTEAKKIQLKNIIDGKSFDLAKLYELSMETKRKVFLEKNLLLLHSENDCQGTVKNDIKIIENYLKNCALETIISNEKHRVILLPPTNRYQSREDSEEEKQNLNELCTRFGLTNVNRLGNVEFLHRSYAEYLVAKYVHNGFHPMIKKITNCLMPQQFVIWGNKEILATKKYDGVQIFLDSLMKEFASTEVKLKSDRFKQLAKMISEKPSGFRYIRRIEVISSHFWWLDAIGERCTGWLIFFIFALKVLLFDVLSRTWSYKIE